MVAAMRGRTTSGTEVRARSANAEATSVASPTPTACTRPFTSTVAMSGWLEVQTTSVGSVAHPLDAVARTCPSTPTSSVRLAGDGVSTRLGSMMPSHDAGLSPPHAAWSPTTTMDRRVR
jgi:hypothetical protein